MGTNIAHAAALAGLLGIVAPNGVVASLELDTLRQPALRILDEYTAHTPYIPARDTFFRLLDGGITAVYMRQGQRKTRLADLVAQTESLLQRQGHRLVDNHIEAQLQSTHCRPVVETGRGHNTNGPS